MKTFFVFLFALLSVAPEASALWVVKVVNVKTNEEKRYVFSASEARLEMPKGSGWKCRVTPSEKLSVVGQAAEARGINCKLDLLDVEVGIQSLALVDDPSRAPLSVSSVILREGVFIAVTLTLFWE